MNLKTTIILVLLVVVGGLGWYFWQDKKSTATDSPTAAFLEKELKPDALTRIEVRRGGQGFVLERASTKEEWSLPGKWPARDKEVEQLLATVTHLHSRFTSFPLEEKKSVLEKDPLIVKIDVGGKKHVLTLADEPGDTNRFSRPTYLRLDDQPEVLRLAPGLVSALARSEEYFRLRRLFPKERVAKDDSLEKVDQVAATAVRITKDKTVEIVKKGDAWEMTRPVHDRVEHDKVKALLAALPNLWAESLVPRKDKSLADMGLQPPRLTVGITRSSGTTLDLYIGDVSRFEERKEMKPGAPNPIGLPPEPKIEIIREEYRYAKLADNDLVFEIKADKLEDKIPTDPLALREPRLAKFKTDDVRRLDINHGGQVIALVFAGDKGKETWKLEGPASLPAEAAQVTELLGKLANLEARDKSIIDDKDVAKYGLAKPAAVLTVTVEEAKKGEPADAPKETKKFIFELGSAEKDKADKEKKVYVRVVGWSRINAVDDSLLTLANRPELAYRSRRLIDAAAKDLARIDVHKGADAFAFEQTAGAWKLAVPVSADVDSGKVGSLAGDLANLEAVELVKDVPSADDLEKLYGLSKPQLVAKIQFADAGKKTQTLAVGNKRLIKQEKDKDAKDKKDPEKEAKEKDKEKAKEKEEYFARLDQGPVFILGKELFDNLGRDSLAYHREKPLDVQAGAIAAIAIQKEGDDLRLQRDGKNWKLAKPFDGAPAAAKLADNLAESLANLKALRYVAHAAKDPVAYGLEKPFLRITFTPAKEDKGKESVLLVGAKEKDKGDRYARLEGSQGVFVVSESDLTGFERKSVDFLAKDVLRLDPDKIQTIRVKGTSSYTLAQKSEGWQVVDSPSPPFAAERDKVEGLLQQFKDLEAWKIVAFGPKVDWASYGLDKPAITLTVVSKDGDKTSEHTLALGKEVEFGQRYARLDQNPAALVLDEFTVKDLSQTHLDFANLNLLKLNPDSLAGIVRQMPGGDLDLTKKGEAWFLKDRPADAATVQNIIRELGHLRAVRVAEHPAKNLATFGLDKPAAVIALKLEQPGGKTGEHIIRLGKQAGEPGKPDAGRYALVDKGDSVVVLAPELSRRLLGPALNFGDHNLANLFGADQAILERPGRKVTFSRVDGSWKMTEPIAADAEETALFDFIRMLSRLRADEIVAEKADPKLYGLDRPQLQWKLRFADQDVLTLSVGGAEPGPSKLPRLYARLANKDLVFLLDPTLSAKVQEEYRKRKPWDSFDPAQVQRIVVQGPKDPFILVKADKDWTVLGKFDLKVNAKVVTDTLDALARLEVLRYVADTKADTQLFGLVPPSLSVELDLPTGKRTLLVGRAEGTSQRYYAAVAGGDTVFVLSEADAQKILRPLGAYAEGGTDKK